MDSLTALTSQYFSYSEGTGLLRRGNIIVAHLQNDTSNITDRSVLQVAGETELPPYQDGGILGAPFLRQDTWTVPLLAASATNTVAILAFEVYIIARAVRGTPSRRHLFLGQCLLLGLLLCSLVGLPLALEPSVLSCAAVRLSVSIAPAVVFGTLLVKTVFLISLNSGVYLPAYYQGLLLFFVVLVQVSISVQWLSVVPADVVWVSLPSAVSPVGGITDTKALSSVPLCAAPYKHVLLSLIYVMVLMMAVAAMAIKCRGFRENYRESSYIGASIGLSLPMWAAWTLAGLMVPDTLRPACVGFGVVFTASVVFILMFIPKGRQLAAVGKDGIYREDRDDRLSTVSAARYSPSFFLFKPLKPPKEVHRPTHSFYKSPPSGMFGYGVLATHPSLYPPSISPMNAPSFSPLQHSTPQPIYSAMRHHKASHLSPNTSHTPPYSVLRPNAATSYGHRTQSKLAPFHRPRTRTTNGTNNVQLYWPPSHLNPHYYKGGSSSRPGDPLYLARLQQWR